ncbi:MAG TPA: hypothetical protein VHC43_01940 [Mycobacteriales bacterium]|nr:hypothetical protein [Mycobacteriales bacterium]
MRGSRLMLTGSLVGAIGTAALLVEAIRAVALNAILSSTSQLVMWVGLGVMAVGGVLLIGAASQESPELRPASSAADD